jgi:hypothetical protein
MEPSNYYNAPIDKVLHFIRGVGLIKANRKGKHNRSLKVAIMVHPYTYIHTYMLRVCSLALLLRCWVFCDAVVVMNVECEMECWTAVIMRNIFCNVMPFNPVAGYTASSHRRWFLQTLKLVVGKNSAMVWEKYVGGWLVYSCCSHLEYRSSAKCFVSLQFHNVRHSVGFLGRVISPSQSCYLTQRQNKHEQTSIPRVGFESTFPALERAKTVHASDRAATVIGREIRGDSILFSGFP